MSVELDVWWLRQCAGYGQVHRPRRPGRAVGRRPELPLPPSCRYSDAWQCPLALQGTPSASRATRREAAVGLTVSGPLPPITRPAPKVTAIARPPSRSWRMPIAGPADRSAGLRSSRRSAGPRAMAHTADHDTRDSSRQSLMTRCYHRKRARAVVFTLLHQVGKSTVLFR